MLTAKLLHCIGLQPKDPSKKYFLTFLLCDTCCKHSKFLFYFFFDFFVDVNVNMCITEVLVYLLQMCRVHFMNWPQHSAELSLVKCRH